METIETIEAAASPPAGVELDLPCYRCGYNVRGLAADGRCPECAAGVDETLRRDASQRAGLPMPLAESDPRWVRTLARGSALMLFGGVGMMAGQALIVFGPKMPRAATAPLFLTPFVALAAGVWMLVAREPTHAGQRRAWRGWILRAAALAWIVSLAAVVLVALSGSWTRLLYYPATALISALLSWGCFSRYRGLAARLAHPALRRLCTALAFLTVAACAVTFVPGAGRIEVRPQAVHILFPVPVLADSLLLVLLPYSLAQLPRLDVLVFVHTAIALVSLAALIALAMLCQSLFRAAALARSAPSRGL